MSLYMTLVCSYMGGVKNVTIMYFRPDHGFIQYKMCVYLRVSHISPSYWSGHIHSYSVPKSLHVPPFRQGSDRHGSMPRMHHYNKTCTLCTLFFQNIGQCIPVMSYISFCNQHYHHPEAFDQENLHWALSLHRKQCRSTCQPHFQIYAVTK